MTTSIQENLKRVLADLPAGVQLVAVSKFHPVERLLEAYEAGQRVFAESRARELVDKAAAMPDDVCWHFIGHLQSNKVKRVVAVAHVIESVDSLRILRAIDNAAAEMGRPVEVLLQAHVALEESKYGFYPDDMLSLVTPELLDSLRAVRIAGVMGMASHVDDISRIHNDFATLRKLFDTLAAGPMANHPEFRILSMGMSDDFHLAVEHGSTAVRIGTDIFGLREY